jgi:phosphatidylglycerol---prolipoprotein diacylglyceryl transferase
MFDLLHSFSPQATIFTFGTIKVYWYGLFIVLGAMAAISITAKLAKRAGLPPTKVFDMAFYIMIFGILGARIYHILLELPYYTKYPADIIKVWQGGLAIHGAIIAGLITLVIFCKKEKIDFWLSAAIMVPGVALGQAIGRWGNYFNQELYGLPTDLPWGIPIDLMHRPLQFLSVEYFHPTFLYESLGNFIIFGILFFLVLRVAAKKISDPKIILLSYLAMYSILRFSTEFLRLDQTLLIAGLRWPQIFSALLFVASIAWIALILKGKVKTKATT